MRRLDNIGLPLLHIFVALTEAGSFNAAKSPSTSPSQPSPPSSAISAPPSASVAAAASASPPSARQPSPPPASSSPTSTISKNGPPAQSPTSPAAWASASLDGIISNPALALQTRISRLIATAPKAFIDLRLGTPQEREQYISEDTLDIAIGPFAKQTPSVTYKPIHREPQTLYCGARHKLFNTPNPTQTDIEFSLLSVRGYRQLEDLHRVSHPRPGAKTIHMEAQATLILSGQFIGFLPRHIGNSYAARSKMRALRPQT